MTGDRHDRHSKEMLKLDDNDASAQISPIDRIFLPLQENAHITIMSRIEPS